MIEALIKEGEGLVYCSLASLLKQRSQARLLQRGGKNVHARQTGQYLSVHKGRGMAFAESRIYQPGDDVRLLDWRVTARTGKIHTKVFEEERERPVLIWIDLRAPMFFATRCCFKSVVAAKVASMLVWKSWLDGDRAGGVIIDAQGGNHVFKPTRSMAGISRFLQALSDATRLDQTEQRDSFLANASLANASLADASLADALKPLNHIIGVGAQVLMLSDFRGMDKQAELQLLAITQRATLDLIRITDPFEHQLPKKGRVRMSKGGHFLSLNMKNKEAVNPYHDVVQKRESRLAQAVRQLKANLINLSTADEQTEQLVKLSRGLR